MRIKCPDWQYGHNRGRFRRVRACRTTKIRSTNVPIHHIASDRVVRSRSIYSFDTCMSIRLKNSGRKIVVPPRLMDDTAIHTDSLVGSHSSRTDFAMSPRLTIITPNVTDNLWREPSGSSGSYVPVIIRFGYILDGLPEGMKADSLNPYT